MKQPLRLDSSKPPERKPKPSAKRASGGLPGEVRIIGGLYKRSKLPVANVAGLRPTPDRVRETLFNWLGQDLSAWKCLDAFAGTGALGFECASRGAAEVLLVEQNARLVEALDAQVVRFKCEQVVRVRKGDGLTTLAQARASFDLVLVDPPFDATWFEQALPLAAQAVAIGGYVYLEGPKAIDAAWSQSMGLMLKRHLKAGLVNAHLFQRVP